MGSLLKRFVTRHLNVFNFLTASIIICICLIVLLPAAHLPLEPSPTTQNDEQQHHHHHHHHHRIPTGEVLICAGFFVFHSIGLLVKRRKTHEGEPLLIAERRMSTVCCSSTRCPSSREIPETLRRTNSTGSLMADSSHEQMLDGAHMIYNRGPDDDCVLLLNQHHQHHTHNTHHEHQPRTTAMPAPRATGQSKYGSMAPDLVRNVLSANDLHDNRSRIYVEEIKASTTRDEVIKWPLSIKVGSFAIIFAVSLVLFDLKIYGLMEALKVFRAAAVGALLYIAFFLVLPKNPAGCGSCTKEHSPASS